MKVTEITYGKKFNLGNYESEEYRFTAVPDAHLQTANEICDALKLLVTEAQSGVTFKVEAAEPAMKPKPKKSKAAPMIIDEEIEPKDLIDEEKSEAEVEEPKKKKFKKKATTYDRANEIHKKLFSEQLRAAAPNWKSTDAGKAKAKNLSVKLDGTDFLDDNGDVLESFITALKKGMK